MEMKSETSNKAMKKFNVSFTPLVVLVTVSSIAALVLLFPTFVCIMGAITLSHPETRDGYRTSAALMIILYLFYFGHLASLILKKINFWFWLASSIVFASYFFGIITYHISHNETDAILRNISPIIILTFSSAISLYYLYTAVKTRKS